MHLSTPSPPWLGEAPPGVTTPRGSRTHRPDDGRGEDSRNKKALSPKLVQNQGSLSTVQALTPFDGTHHPLKHKRVSTESPSSVSTFRTTIVVLSVSPEAMPLLLIVHGFSPLRTCNTTHNALAGYPHAGDAYWDWEFS